MDFAQTIHCKSRLHCHACRTNESWRNALGAPGQCPYGEGESAPLLSIRNMAANPARPAEPTALELASNFASAVARWAAAGFQVASREAYDGRTAACAACEFWDGSARLGLGKCAHKKCGCTRFKRWLASERCPLGKWRD